MRVKQRTTLSLEAIKFQTGKKLEKELVGYFTMMRNMNIDQVDAFSEIRKELIKCIFFHLKMPVEFKVIEDPANSYSMFVLPPTFTDKHTLVAGKLSGSYNEKMRMGVIKELLESPSKILGFGVDYQTGQLTGLAQQLPSTIYIGTSILKDANVKPSWMAAVLTHELGHIETMFLSMRYATSSSWAIRFAIEALDDTQENSDFIATVSQLGNVVRPEDLERLKAVDAQVQKELVTAIILDKFRDQLRSEIGTSLADQTTAEAVADQFLVRFGDPMAFAEFMEYALRQGRENSSGLSGDRMAMLGVAALLATFILGPVTAGAAVMLGAVIGMHWSAASLAENVAYDKPYERVKRMRNDLVAAIKENDDAAVRAQLLAQIKALDSILPELKKNDTVIAKILPLFSGSLRNLRKEQNLVRSLEELFTNPLFVRHAQLSQLNEIEG